MRVSISLAAVAASLVLAAVSAASDDLSTGPALGVARISIVQGDVAIMRGDSGDWIAAKPNMPVVEGDSVQVNTAARAEIQLAYGNFLRLGGGTEVEFVKLGGKQFRVRLLAGVAIYSELPGGEADVDIETPLAAVRPMKAGRYIVSVQPAETQISVPKGRTEVAFQITSQILDSGRTMIVREGPTGTEFEKRRGIPDSDLSQWAADRDREARQSVSHRYVSKDIYGAGQLDYYGEWRYVPNVGHSWFPYVTPRWSPYRHGSWNWVDYYGWTWVGSEPWGWAPYHWGRWYRDPVFGWAWYPGAPTLRHVWRPALVTFFYLGSPTWRDSQRVGWCPLAPGESYRPWYGRRYYSGAAPVNINVANDIRLDSQYRNAREQSGVSYLESSNFGRAASQTPRALRTGEMGAPTVIRGALPIVPERASQGTLLQARTSTSSAAALTALRRSRSSSSLRDGTARVPFTAQRDRIRDSVDQFRRAYPSAGSNGSDGNVRTASQRAPISGSSSAVSLGARTPAGSSIAGRAAASGTGRGATGIARSGSSTGTTRSSSAIPGSPGVAVASPAPASSSRSRPAAGTSVRRPSSIYAPRTRSRIGATVQVPPVLGDGSTAGRRSAASRPQAVRPSGTLGAGRTQGRSRPTFGATGAGRPSGTGASTRSPVYTPRNRPGVGASGDLGASRSSSARSAAGVYAPRTRSRVSVRSSPGASGPSSRGGPGHSRSGIGDPGYSGSRSSSRSSGSYGGSSRSSYPSSSSRSSSSAGRATYGSGSSRSSSSSSGSYGSRSSSSSGGSYGSRSSSSRSSASRSSSGSSSHGGRSSSSSSGNPATR